MMALGVTELYRISNHRYIFTGTPLTLPWGLARDVPVA